MADSSFLLLGHEEKRHSAFFADTKWRFYRKVINLGFSSFSKIGEIVGLVLLDARKWSGEEKSD